MTDGRAKNMTATARDYAMLRFAGVSLLLPQASVAAIEMSSNCVAGSEVPGALATLRTASGEWPVFALGADVKPVADCPMSYAICAAFDADDGAAFALACEEAGTLTLGTERELVPLHPCMRLSASPVEAMSLQEGRLLLVSDVEAMRRYLLMEMAA